MALTGMRCYVSDGKKFQPRTEAQVRENENSRVGGTTHRGHVESESKGEGGEKHQRGGAPPKGTRKKKKEKVEKKKKKKVEK